MIEISIDKNDDENFIKWVRNALNFNLRHFDPKDVFLIKVDHWFDFKWLAFSHKAFGSVGIWRRPFRIPPFIPDRIVQQTYFEKFNGNYQAKKTSVHIYQQSMENALRKIENSSAIYIWYSGNTEKTTQASLMLYNFMKEFQNSWYVSFVKKTDWQIYKTEAVSKAEIELMTADVSTISDK